MEESTTETPYLVSDIIDDDDSVNPTEVAKRYRAESLLAGCVPLTNRE